MTDQICISPVDGRELARRPTESAAAMEAILADARRAQLEWAEVPIAERGRKMLVFLDALLGLNQQIIPELALQMGRPVRFGGEMRGVEERVKHCVATAEASLAPIVPEPKPGFRRMIKRTPLGLVFVIAPWNYPFLTAVNTIVPALIAGNAVLLKHAAQTILVGERFQEAMDKADLPKGLFRNVVLDHEQAGALIAAGAFDHINFTGSVAGGRAVEKAAAGTFTSLGLELGGKDPAYVRADADLDFAIENIVDGAFYNSGQCCCGVERIYVHESLYDRFVAGAVELTSRYVLGNPLDDATTLGPMSAARFAETVRSQTREALQKGAKAHLDPKAFPADREGTPYLAPQILTGVDHSMRVMVEESFGPVVGIMKVRDDDEAVRLMNDSPYGLTASIWTREVDVAEALGDRIQTGTVYMNRCDYLDPALAWTGVKDTGRGASLSEIGFQLLTRPKSFHLREAR
ncbi:aldehyde dehydrogenase family protein [Hansschlegelia beijingensis]|uniref:Acyl-CoA reductase-like NAD-dependent aldehyde dehydrogenase n=1 Tax=Hansschlegelia beijingensis TaxID=1133344 RepID=A0A7W6GH18_9HYPH|nr:aldehyde dehydrogenase family protein [Hansschlegelia beijingensis]MBB3973309.1 acyl-CoA reductase-like NAD-dependent aldehyde dehydrogenase [Hansschlegelia beijingensis]